MGDEQTIKILLDVGGDLSGGQAGFGSGDGFVGLGYFVELVNLEERRDWLGYGNVEESLILPRQRQAQGSVGNLKFLAHEFVEVHVFEPRANLREKSRERAEAILPGYFHLKLAEADERIAARGAGLKFSFFQRDASGGVGCGGRLSRGFGGHDGSNGSHALWSAVLVFVNRSKGRFHLDNGNERLLRSRRVAWSNLSDRDCAECEAAECCDD